MAGSSIRTNHVTIQRQNDDDWVTISAFEACMIQFKIDQSQLYFWIFIFNSIAATGKMAI